MSFDDLAGYDDWLEERAEIPSNLDRAMRLERNRAWWQALNDLAGALGIKKTTLQPLGYAALRRLADYLEEILEEGPPGLLEDRHKRIAAAFVKPFYSEDLTALACQFGWGNNLYVDRVPIAHVEEELKKAFRDRLADSLYNLLRRWSAADSTVYAKVQIADQLGLIKHPHAGTG